MKILILSALLLTSVITEAQNEISIKKMQDFLSAKGIDDVENDLRILDYSFRQIETTSDGISKLFYNRLNSKTYALDFIIFFKNKSNVGFSSICFITYEEQQFYNLKTECTSTDSLQALPEKVEDECLKRTYISPQYQFQFKICTEQSNGKVLYRIDIFPQ